MAYLERINSGPLPPQRSMEELMPGKVVKSDRPPRDESWEERAAREGAHVGRGAGGSRELQERNWLREKMGLKPLICLGDRYVTEDEVEAWKALHRHPEGDVL